MNKSYWEKTAVERALTAEDQMEEHINFELMKRGIAEPEPPKLLQEPAMPTLETEVFYEAGGLVFRSAEDAEKLVSLNPMRKSTDFNIQTNRVYYFEPLYNWMKKVEKVELMDEDTYISIHDELLAIAHVNSYNAVLRQKHEVDIENAKSTRDELLKDWKSCQDMKRKTDSIMSTYRKYHSLTGENYDTALHFLQLIYDKPSIIQAFEWNNLPRPDFSQNDN